MLKPADSVPPIASRPPLQRRALVAVLALCSFAALIAAPAASAEDQLTPVIANVIATPEAVLGDDGRQHLAYELQLVNRASAEATVLGIKALAGRRVVGSLAGKQVSAVMVPYTSSVPSAKLRPGQGGYVLMDVSFPAKAKLPKRIVHRLKLSYKPKSVSSVTDYLAAPTRVITRPAVVVAPPLRGPNWVVANGCCAALSAHRAAVLPVNGATYVAERFAIDFVQLTPSNRMVEGPLDMFSSYAFFGATIHSAAKGKVVGVLDNLPETPAGNFPKGATAATAGGNHVVVDIGHGRFAFYAHMQPGSITVKVGDRVSVGQPLGRLGNSGNSDAPHLHFHVMDGPSPLASNGMPFRFRSFSVHGTVTNLGDLTKGAVAAIDPGPVGPRAKQLPLDNQIVDF